MCLDLTPLASRWILPLLLVLIFLGAGECIGQRYQATTYTEADGLANSTVFSMVQDSSGVLWIARRLGISTYDGNTFYNFSLADGLQATSYSFIFKDEKEHIWAMPESGPLFVTRFNGKKWQVISTAVKPFTSEFKASYSSLDVYYDNGKAVVLAGTADRGLIWYSENKWRLFTTKDGLPDIEVNSVREFNGSIYVASNKGLTILNNRILKPCKTNISQLPDGRIYALGRNGNELWLFGDGWLGYISNGAFTMVAKGFDLPVTELGRHCFLYAGQNGVIYFGNSFKVMTYALTSNSIESLDRTNGLISGGANAILVDRELNTWISGYRGITKISSVRFASYSEKDGLFSNEVASGIEVSPGNYLFGHDGGLTFSDGKHMSTKVLNPSRVEPNYETRVIDIQKDSKGDPWMAVCSQGLAHMNKEKQLTW